MVLWGIVAMMLSMGWRCEATGKRAGLTNGCGLVEYEGRAIRSDSYYSLLKESTLTTSAKKWILRVGRLVVIFARESNLNGEGSHGACFFRLLHLIDTVERLPPAIQAPDDLFG